MQKWRQNLTKTCTLGWGTRRMSPCLQLGLSSSVSRIEALQSLWRSLLPQPPWWRERRHQPHQLKSLLLAIRGWRLGTSRRRRLTLGLLASRMTLGFPWRKLKISSVQTTWRYLRGCQQMKLRGVISTSSSKYLCDFTLCSSFPFLFSLSFIYLFIYIYIYIYTSLLFFFLGVGRESSSYFKVFGLRG